MKDFFKRNLLLFVVFITGAAVLVIEVVAVRILSPYFGSTIFTVSSVLGVILAALSLGYYFGGKMADKYPSKKLFFGIIFISGVSVLFLQFLNLTLLPILGNYLSIINGPLIASVILFFIPAILMGMLSPLVIKLQQDQSPDRGIGGISGQVFFWSTLGSIFGSLFTGFILIPNFGINQIVLTTGFILILLGFLPIVTMANSKKLSIKLLILLFIIGSMMTMAHSARSETNFIYQKDGVYEKLLIYDEEYNGRMTRFFVQDRSPSSAMFLDGDDLVFEYTKYYSLYKVANPNPKEILVMGAAAYSIPKKMLSELPEANVDVVEIEPALEDLAKKYFNLPDSPKLTTYIEDGRHYLTTTDKKYDVIFSDVYSSLYSIPMHFTTQEFYQIAKDKLNQDGIFIANFTGSLSRQKPSLLFSEIKTFESVFDNTYYIAAGNPADDDMQNIIIVAINNDKKINWDSEEILVIDDPIVQKVKQQLIDLNRFDISSYSILTDNYAPVDYLTALGLKREDYLKNNNKIFDGKEILGLIEQQLDYGPRYLSAPGHEKIKDFLIANAALADKVDLQSWNHKSKDGSEYELTNIIARFNTDKEKRIILATHYDSKKFAHNDAKFSGQAVPGANDGASGTAVLLEILRKLAKNSEDFNIGIDIIFFDGEEGEEHITDDYSQWEPLGSNYFVENLEEFYPDDLPQNAIVLDMICDKDLFIQPEMSSVTNASELVNDFWQIAIEEDDTVFSINPREMIVDDHSVLQQTGINSILLIDYDYPYFHTTKDTLDKCSADSLELVTKVVFSYIKQL
jgi:spermidine synthase